MELKKYTKEGNTLVVSYFNNIGEEKQAVIIQNGSDMVIRFNDSNGQSIDEVIDINVSYFETQIQTAVNKIPKTKVLIQSVQVIGDKISIVGKNNITKDFEISEDLTTDMVGNTGKTQIQVYNELAAFIQAALGAAMTSMFAPFGTGYVYINSTKLDYNVVAEQSGTVMGNATTLASELFNA